MGVSDDPLEQRFLEHLRVERQLSERTQQSYARDLSQVRLVLVASEVTDWRKLTEKALRRAVAQLHQEGLSGRSLQRILSSLRSFFRYLNRENLFDQNPALSVKAPKAAHRLPQTLDQEQITQLVEIETNEPLELRDLAMIELLYSSGLRVSELVGADINDLDFSEAQIRVLGKGRKVRVVPVGSKAKLAINRWLSARSELASPGEQALFVGQHGRRLTARSVELRLKRWGALASTSGRLYPHRLRHSFATEMLAGSRDLRAVQELLGHADISTTQIYTHLDFGQLKSIYDQAHPRAKRNEDD